jgi:hypothetical protein
VLELATNIALWFQSLLSNGSTDLPHNSCPDMPDVDCRIGTSLDLGMCQSLPLTLFSASIPHTMELNNPTLHLYLALYQLLEFG